MSENNNKAITNLILLIVLAACLWVGWSDFDLVRPEMSQDEIRESIRENIRMGIQVAIQYLIPVTILGYFVKKLMKK